MKKLIYDIGMHLGEDTEYYLKMGYKVVAIEASNDLILKCKIKFVKDISNKRLTILEGVLAKQDFGNILFYKNTKKSVWGTASEEFMKRNELEGAVSNKEYVKVLNFYKILEKYGSPYYIKIDIEGFDVYILEKIFNTNIRPLYLSIESSKNSIDDIIKELNLFEKLGYTLFKIVEQSQIPNTFNFNGTYNFPQHSSGDFGKYLSGEWLTKEQAIKQYKIIFDIGYDHNVWYDTHAQYTGVLNE